MRMLMLGDARTEHLARWARHFRARGDLVLVASAEGGRADVHMNLPVKWPALGYPMLVPVLRRLIADFRPNIVVAHYLPNYGLLAALSQFRPTVAVGWGSDLLVLPGRNALQRSRLHFVAKRASAFLVDAQMLVEPLVKLGAPVERVYVCPFGVDDDVLQLDTVSRASRPFAVLSTRRLDRRYRVDILLEALSKVSNPFAAQIANDGSHTQKLRQQASRLGLNDRVTFPGVLDRSQYLERLRQSHIYVSTSPTDSTSVSLLEAMAAGLACVVPDIPGNREWVTHDQNGVLYAPLDATDLATKLAGLLQDPAHASRLGSRARQTVQARGRWSHTIRRAELLFAELVRAEPCHAS
jgi:glycosyltransferase involved in cell wall biosynthesis